MPEKLLNALKNKLFWVSVGILSLGVSIGWSAVWRESFDKLSATDNSKKSAGEKAAVLNRIGKTEKKLVSYQDVFSKSQDASWLIETINRIAEESGVVLISVTPSYSSSGIDAYKKVSLNISTICGYH